MTDEKYDALAKRVDELERRMNSLAMQYSSLLMKGDYSGITQPAYKKPKKRKDTTKYVFNGQKLCKRQLVLECVKKYLADNEISRIEDVKTLFPDYVQGSLGIIKRIEEAERYQGASKRFFFLDQDILRLDDGDYVVCSQWDVNNIDRFLRLAEDLEMEIKPANQKY